MNLMIPAKTRRIILEEDKYAWSIRMIDLSLLCYYLSDKIIQVACVKRLWALRVAHKYKQKHSNNIK